MERGKFPLRKYHVLRRCVHPRRCSSWARLRGVAWSLRRCLRGESLQRRAILRVRGCGLGERDRSRRLFGFCQHKRVQQHRMHYGRDARHTRRHLCAQRDMPHRRRYSARLLGLVHWCDRPCRIWGRAVRDWYYHVVEWIRQSKCLNRNWVCWNDVDFNIQVKGPI